MAPAVRLREAVALAGRYPLLAGASLELGEGEVVHLRGPNGAGKTSLLKVLAGLLAVHSGEASVLGHDLVADRRSARREVAMVGHRSFLYEELTVEENLRFAVRAARAPVSGITGVLDRFGFGGRLATIPVGRCSAGQQRRASLAVLVARQARLWLLDEPHAGLDQEGRDLLDSLLSESAACGRTVLFASHELDRAEEVSRRVVQMAGGRIVDAGGQGAGSDRGVALDADRGGAEGFTRGAQADSVAAGEGGVPAGAGMLEATRPAHVA